MPNRNWWERYRHPRDHLRAVEEYDLISNELDASVIVTEHRARGAYERLSEQARKRAWQMATGAAVMAVGIGGAVIDHYVGLTEFTKLIPETLVAICGFGHLARSTSLFLETRDCRQDISSRILTASGSSD